MSEELKDSRVGLDDFEVKLIVELKNFSQFFRIVKVDLYELDGTEIVALFKHFHEDIWTQVPLPFFHFQVLNISCNILQNWHMMMD